MTILVTGANGQLGNEIRIVSKESNDNYIFTDVTNESEESIEMLHKLAGPDVCVKTTKLDITDINSIRAIVQENRVNVIVNCAAYTNVDTAEDNYDLAELLNAKAPENLAKVMKEVNGFLIHISTDYVFGKEPYNTPCKEDQKGAPTGVYGQTKLHGEENIQALGCNYVIIRTAWLYSEFGRNFVKTVLHLTATEPQLKVVIDQVGTPTYAFDLAQVIIKIIDSYKNELLNLKHRSYTKGGIYHFSNEGLCSWFDFTKLIAAYSGQCFCDIQPCHSDEFPSKVKRPAYSVLDKTKIKETFALSIPYWIDSLSKMILNIKS